MAASSVPLRTLVVAPHPDDEVLGCGGTLLRRKAEGAYVGWLIVTAMSEVGGWSADRITQRESEIEKVSKLIGFDAVYNLRLPPAHLDEMPLAQLVALFSDVFRKYEPHEVFIPHHGDAHSDHNVVFQAATACTKWFRFPFVQRVLAYEAPSETEFGLSREKGFFANYFVDISSYIAQKLEIMQVYSTEIGDFPFPRSSAAIQALAQWRGANSGYLAAEAFDLLLERS